MSFDLFGDDDDDDSLFHPKTTKTKYVDDKIEEKLPELPFINTNSDNKIPSNEKNTLSDDSDDDFEVKSDINNAPTIEPAKTIQIEQKPQLISTSNQKTKRTGKKVHTKYEVEQSLNLFKENLQQKFSELQLQISSLKPERPQYKHTALLNSKIASQIKSIVMESSQKDRKINELEEQINKFTDAFTEREERERLRKEIQKKTEELKEEQNNYLDNTNLASFVQNLERQLSNVDSDYSKAESLEKSINNNKINSDKSKIEQEKQQMEDNLKRFEENKKELEIRLNSLLKDNEELANKPIPDYSKEIAEIKQKQKDGVQKVVRIIASGTLKAIQSAVNPKRTYSAEICIKAIKQALQEQADDILDPDGYEYDE